MQEGNQKFRELNCSMMSSQENLKFILYKGSSMNSTLQDMDALYYIPNKRVRSGDVVVIEMPEYENKIIHRVISVSKQGIRTMGDCNSRPDRWLLSPDKIIGSVAYGYRGRKRFSVHGGSAGLAQMFQVRLKYRIIKIVHPILNKISYNLISRLMIPIIQPKQIVFVRPEGNEIHLIAFGRVIGRRLPGQKWQIKSPFSFFLEESNLLD